MSKNKKDERWDEDTTIHVKRHVRAKLKVNAAVEGKTLQDYLEQKAYEKDTK